MSRFSTEIVTESPEHALVPALTICSEDGPMIEDLRTISWEPVEHILGMIMGHRAQARYNFRPSSRLIVQATFGAESYPTFEPISWHVQDFRWQPPYTGLLKPPCRP